MADKPSYLGQLNAIAVGEARGQALLETWAEATADERLAADLCFVAAREREHAAAFAKRLAELGFGVIERDDPKFARRLRLAGDRGKSDLKKFRKLLGYGAGRTADVDRLGELLSDPNIDPRTGALLGRFIAEERDSGRRLRAAWQRCRNAAEEPASDDPGSGFAELSERLVELAGQMERLQRTLRS